MFAFGEFQPLGKTSKGVEANCYPDKVARGKLEDGMPILIGTDQVKATLKEKKRMQKYKITAPPDSTIPANINEQHVFHHDQSLKSNNYLSVEALVDRTATIEKNAR